MRLAMPRPCSPPGLRGCRGYEPIEISGHLYIDGGITLSYKLKPTGKIKMGLAGTGAMLMRFGGNPSTDPDFGFLAYTTASPYLQIGDFTLDLSGLKGTALLYIDVPSPNLFKFALRMTAEINLSDLFSTVIPQLPQFIKDAVKLLGPKGGVKAELDVYADSGWWGIKMGITLDMQALLGAHPRQYMHSWLPDSVDTHDAHAQALWVQFWGGSSPLKWRVG